MPEVARCRPTAWRDAQMVVGTTSAAAVASALLLEGQRL